MKFEKLKKGCYIKWTASRMFKSWDTFGKVTSITKNKVKIFTYDDFSEITLSRDGDAVKEEISLCTKKDVVDYLNQSIYKLNIKQQQAAQYFKNQTIITNNQIAKLSKLLITKFK